jgi:hypothetical protein
VISSWHQFRNRPADLVYCEVSRGTRLRAKLERGFAPSGGSNPTKNPTPLRGPRLNRALSLLSAGIGDATGYTSAARTYLCSLSAASTAYRRIP